MISAAALGRRGPHVGHKVADGEVDLVPNGRDDRQRGVEDRARHHLFVKGPQVLQAAAAAGDEDQVNRRSPIANSQLSSVEFVEQPNGRSDFLRRAIALHAAGRQDDLQRGIAAFDHVQHVANGGARGRGDQADALRVARQRAFPFRRKQPFGLELLLELLERHLQRADALQLDLGDAQLVLPARLIHRHVPLQHDLPPVLQQRAIHLRLAPEQHAAHLRAGVLEREVDMAGALQRADS